MSWTGTVTAVKERPAGSELSADTSSGATSITPLDLAQFDETGQVVIAGATYTYTADWDTGTLTISPGLVGAQVSGEAITLSPATTDRVAYVESEDQEEALEIRVPHTLYDKLGVGIRIDEADSQPVIYDLVDDEFMVLDVLGLEPVVDGSYLEPASVDETKIGSVSASVITGTISAGSIGSINASSITGSIVASQIGSVNASAISGTISAAQIGSVNASAITGTISAGQITSITAGQITGTITSGQIGSVSASVITGGITASQITSVNATAISGSITAGQITSIAATQITGSITAGQITSIAASQITGSIGAAQIGSVNASAITGGITSTQITSVNAATITVGTLSSTQIGSVNAASITVGTISASQIGSVAASTITGTITSGQIASVSASTITGSITSAQIGSVAASTITGSITSAQIGSVAAGTITGTITSGQIASVNAGQVVVTTGLSDISANMGSITAGTITGATFRTGSSNPKVIFDSSGISAINSSGVTTFQVDSATGKITTLGGIGGGNLLRDSSFETNPISANWTATNGTLTSDNSITAKHGSRTGKLAATSSTAAYIQQSTAASSIQVGRDFTASAWIRGDASTTNNAFVRLEFFNSSNVSLGSTDSTAVALSTTFTRHTVLMTSPANTSYARVYVRFSTNTSGKILYADSVQLEEGSFASAYAPKPDEILPATVGDTEIADVGASKITGSITASQIGSVNASAITGSITAGQITSIAATQITGSITSAQIGSVAATTITGSIVAAQIGSVNTTALSGLVTAAQIDQVNASDITGGIISSQITSVAATTITGTLVSTQIGSVNASTITVGTISAGQIGSVNASAITGTINAATQIGSIATTQLTGTITAAQIDTVAATDITGTLTAAQIGSINANQINITTGLSDISTSVGTITSGTITAATYRTSSTNPKVQMDSTGLVAYDSLGSVVFNLASSGSFAATGSINFGAAGGSSLNNDDSVEVVQQTTGTYMAPSLVNSISGLSSGTGFTSVALNLPKSKAGNQMLIVLFTDNSAGSPTNPAGWQVLKSDINATSGTRTTILGRTTSTALSGSTSVTITWTGSSNNWASTTLEFAGLIRPEDNGSLPATDVSGAASGNSTTPSATTSTTLAQTVDLAIGVCGTSWASTTARTSPAGWSDVANALMPMTVTWKATAATTAVTFAPTLATTDQWLDQVQTFKARLSGNPATPASGSLKLFTKLAGGTTPRPYTIDSAGTVGALLQGPATPNTYWTSNPGGPSNSTASGSAFQTYIQRIVVQETCTISGIQYRVGATGATGNVSAALYDLAGTTRLATQASVAHAASGATQQITFTSAATGVQPGVYWALITFGNASATYHGGMNLSLASATTLGALAPATTITVPTTGGAICPYFSTF